MAEPGSRPLLDGVWDVDETDDTKETSAIPHYAPAAASVSASSTGGGGAAAISPAAPSSTADLTAAMSQLAIFEKEIDRVVAPFKPKKRTVRFLFASSGVLSFIRCVVVFLHSIRSYSNP